LWLGNAKKYRAYKNVETPNAYEPEEPLTIQVNIPPKAFRALHYETNVLPPIFLHCFSDELVG
jgi:hypothetical protein